MVKVKNTRPRVPPERVMRDLSQHELRVGYFAESRYPNGTPVAYVAAIQEFGYPEGGIPPRPTLRPTAQERKKEWAEQILKGTRQALLGKASVVNVLEAVGMAAAGDVRKTIATLTNPPLAPSTLRNRQSKKKTPGVSTKPLIDTSLMINSVAHSVTKKNVRSGA